MAKTCWTYILASDTRTIYVGMTCNLEGRIGDHRMRRIPGFTCRYNVTRLVHVEEYDGPNAAIAREKEIKGWRREKIIQLIEESNPDWSDLATDWW